MKFTANQRHWWTRAAAAYEYSLEGRYLPLLGLGGLLAALIFAAWRFGPAAEEVPSTVLAAADNAGPADFHQLPAIRIHLRADAAGRLASIAFNGRPVKDAADLRPTNPGISRSGGCRCNRRGGIGLRRPFAV